MWIELQGVDIAMFGQNDKRKKGILSLEHNSSSDEKHL